MAKNILPTNYQDDIMNESAGGKRKYRMIYNEDGTVSFDDLTVYDLEGSDYGAGDINRTNEAVNQSLDKAKVIDDINAIGAITQEGYAMGALAGKAINDSLQAENGQGFQFAYDSASGKYGYKAEVEGADTFFPFSSSIDDLEISGLNPNGDATAGSVTWVAPEDMIIAVYSYSNRSFSLSIGGTAKSLAGIYSHNSPYVIIYGGVYKVLKGQTVAMKELRYYTITFK